MIEYHFIDVLDTLNTIYLKHSMAMSKCESSVNVAELQWISQYGMLTAEYRLYTNTHTQSQVEWKLGRIFNNENSKYFTRNKNNECGAGGHPGRRRRQCE